MKKVKERKRQSTMSTETKITPGFNSLEVNVSFQEKNSSETEEAD